MQSNYGGAYDFQMPNGVDQHSEYAIACTSRFCVQNTESFRVRYAETVSRLEQNDHVKNFEAKSSRSAWISSDRTTSLR